MNIGQAATQAGLSAKTIRYYEEAGLLERTARAANGYRRYSEQDVHRMRFISRARSLGFTVAEVAELLGLYSDRERSSGDVKALALQTVARIERKITELQGMRDALRHLAQQCHGDARPECPILEDLAGPAPAQTSLGG